MTLRQRFLFKDVYAKASKLAVAQRVFQDGATELVHGQTTWTTGP